MTRTKTVTLKFGIETIDGRIAIFIARGERETIRSSTSGMKNVAKDDATAPPPARHFSRY